MSDQAGRRGRWLIAAMVSSTLILFLAQEIYRSDEPITPVFVIFESLEWIFLAGGSIMSTLLILRVRAQEEESRALRDDLQAVRAESVRWREEMGDHVRALGTAIRRQFADWRLTAAEQEVSLLLLKGLSHKEIARVRNTGEATIRQQAGSLYQKAGMSGRAALSAFFLDDLLAEPVPERAAPVQPRGVTSSVTRSRPATS